MAIERDDKNLKFIPFDVATRPPKGLIEHIKESYWVCDAERGVLYFRTFGDNYSAQCNESEKITKTLAARNYPWAEVRFISSVFRRINPRDYC